MFKYSFPLIAQLGYAGLSLAASGSTITIPWVGYQANYFNGYEGRVLTDDGHKTTYLVNCPPSVTSCISFDPDLTFIAGPSTYDLILDMGFSYTSSGCTFAGGATPTTATCSYTQSYHFGTHSVSERDTYQVPGSGVYRSIVTATLPIETGAVTTVSTAQTTAAAMTAAGPTTPNATATPVTGPTSTAATSTNSATPTGVAVSVTAPKILLGAVFVGAAMHLQL
ncbi:Pc21g05760 [Talaromyces islandicus]|uniref:Pc21g05760 n=1 Tax=Talaromyces islandicus TaxID=28573 RepID=A0A0U1LUS3_TALIS|nr:Pc21g05760 [Talaromyces islandicus]